MMGNSELIGGRKKTASLGYFRTIEPLLASDRQTPTRVAKAYDRRKKFIQGQFVVRSSGRAGYECGACVSFAMNVDEQTKPTAEDGVGRTDDCWNWPMPGRFSPKGCDDARLFE
jgi:hypothetical protein